MGSEDNGGNVLAREFWHKISDGIGTDILEDESRVSLDSTRIYVPPQMVVVIDGVHSTSISPSFTPISNLIDSMCSLVMQLFSLSISYTSGVTLVSKEEIFLSHVLWSPNLHVVQHPLHTSLYLRTHTLLIKDPDIN